jgi:hypothetical protein
MPDRIDQGDPSWGPTPLGEPRCDYEIPGYPGPDPTTDPTGYAKWIQRYALTYPDCLDPVTHLYDLSLGTQNQWTIGGAGCTLASATMILNSALNLQGTQPKTPLDVNARQFDDPNDDPDWGPVAQVFYNRQPNLSHPSARLKTNDVYWDYIADLAGGWGSASFTHEPIYSPRPTWEATIRDILCDEARPVAVRVSGHTFIAHTYIGSTGWIGIHDPSHTRNFKWLHQYTNAGYHIERLDVIRAGAPSPVARATVVGPAEMLIRDAMGRRSGYASAAQEVLNEVPCVEYVTEWPTVDDDGPDAPVALPPDRNIAEKVAYIYPGLDPYSLQFDVVGAGEGETVFEVREVGFDRVETALVTELLQLAPGELYTRDEVIAPCHADGVGLSAAGNLVGCLTGPDLTFAAGRCRVPVRRTHSHHGADAAATEAARAGLSP